MTVTTDLLHDGLGNTLYRVSRVFPNAASAAKAVDVLEAINPEAFSVGSGFDIQPKSGTPIPDGPIQFYENTALDDPPPTIAAMLVELEELGRVVEFDDDTGAPGEPPRCRANGGCD